MKKLAFLFIALVAIISMSACRIEKVNNNEPVKTFTLNLRDFQSIGNYSNCDIHFTQSSTYKVVLKAPQQWYDTHTIAVRDGQLIIDEKQKKQQKGITVLHINSGGQYAELWISAPTLAAASIGGSGDFYAESNLTGNNLEMSIAGSGDTKLKNITLSGNFTYTVAGSGDIETGTLQAKAASFGIAGSGDVDSKLAKVETTKLTIAGSGDGTLDFDHCGYAHIGISGSGDVTLSGTLQSLDKSIAGSGDIDTDRLQLGK